MLEVGQGDAEGGSLTAGRDAHAVEGFGVLALAGAGLVGQHALEVKAQDRPSGLGHRLVGTDTRRPLLLGRRRPGRVVQQSERSFELGGRQSFQAIRPKRRVDGVKIVYPAGGSQLDFDLAGERLAPGYVGFDGIERELAYHPISALHGAADPELAEGEQLAERPAFAQAGDGIVGRTRRPVRRGRLRGHFAFVLFAMVHGAVRPAQSLHGQQPMTTRFALTQPAGVAAAQEVAVRRVEVVIEHLPLSHGAEGQSPRSRSSSRVSNRAGSDTSYLASISTGRRPSTLVTWIVISSPCFTSISSGMKRLRIADHLRLRPCCRCG